MFGSSMDPVTRYYLEDSVIFGAEAEALMDAREPSRVDHSATPCYAQSVDAICGV